jgi:hypothetical protein
MAIYIIGKKIYILLYLMGFSYNQIEKFSMSLLSFFIPILLKYTIPFDLIFINF